MNEVNKWVDEIYEKMLASAERHAINRPVVICRAEQLSISKDLVLPTLEDLKNVLFEPVNPEAELGYPLKIITIEDIKDASILSNTAGSSPNKNLVEKIDTLVYNIVNRLTYQIQNFNKEINFRDAAIRILDTTVEGDIVEISLDTLLRKYYDDIHVERLDDLTM